MFELLPRATVLALLDLQLACVGANRTEAPPSGAECAVRADHDDGSVRVANEAHGYAMELPSGFAVDCEGDGAFAELGMLSADYEQPSVGLVNVLLMVVATESGEDAHARLLEQFGGLDRESFGIAAGDVEVIAATAGGRELRCYGGPARGVLERSHYYACTAIEQRGDGAVLGSVVRILASGEEWRINGDASVQMIHTLSRAWTLTPSPEAHAAREARGCAERFGVEPDALASACGFGPLLAQTELQTYCELQYATSSGDPGPVVTLREFRNRDADAAWSLHRASFGETPEETFAELPGIRGSHWSSFAGYRWAFLPGWSHARRIGWFESDCDLARMMPVLQGMIDAPQPEPEPAPRWTPSTDVSDSLASSYGARTNLDLANLDTRELPMTAKKIIITLLSAAARNDEALVQRLLSPGAGFGLPDRREFEAWPIAEGDNLSIFVEALRSVASRFPADAKFNCEPIKPKYIDGVARGEHPMWCSYISADGFDLLVFRLLAINGVAHVDYVGMFETQPTSTSQVPIPALSKSMEPLPPLTPDAVKLITPSRPSPASPP